MSHHNELLNHHAKLLNSDVHFCHIDGAKCASLEEFYNAIVKGLLLPDYFGYNLDSLEELLYDLSWIEQPYIILFISNTDDLVSSDTEKRMVLLELLESIDHEILDVIFEA